MSVGTYQQTNLLAKLLATENLSVQYTPGIKTAMFDLKNRVLMLPIWDNISNDLRDLLLVHETGHAIDSPNADDYKAAYETIAKNVFPNEKISDSLKKTVQGFLNVIEDARIDKRQKRRYPGARKNYLVGYKELIERDFFGTAKRDLNSMNFIDRVNIYFKGGSIHHNIEFSPEERAFLKRIENLETFSETVSLTEEIYLFCKDKLEQENEMHIDLGINEDEEGEEDDDFDFDDNESNGFNSNGEDSDDADSEEGESDGEAAQQSEGSSIEKTQGEGDIQSKSSGSAGDGAGAGDDELPSNAPVSETDENWQRKSETLVKDENAQYIYTSFPDIDWTKAIHDYKHVLADWRGTLGRYIYKESYEVYRRQLTEWKTKEKDAISFLVKEFEQRKAAELYSRNSVAKTGVIDTNKLHSYKFNDDIFRRLSVTPQGKNHGFIMFLDWSGSMQQGLRHTLKQLFTLVLFCKQIQVPFEVYAFKDCYAEDPFSYMDKTDCIGLGTCVLRQFLSSKMTITELNEAMTFLWAIGNGNNYIEGMGGTPLNEAIYLATKVINDFRAKNKLEIVNTIFLTDGEGNGLNGIKNSSGRENPDYRITKKYLHNDAGVTYEFYPYDWSSSVNTSTLLKMLKAKTGCNLVGFFLLDNSFNWFARRFQLIYGNADYLSKVQKFWKENKFYPVTSEGYDEYYVIDARALRDTKNELEINVNGTTKSMAKAFSKFAAKKSTNRVLLRKFIDKVTGQSKKVA